MSKRLAVIGAGPIGIEAATLAAEKGWDVNVYEAGIVGQNIARWEHVRFFSPWSMNRSPWGVRALEGSGATLEPEDAFPSGKLYRETYLLPLAEALGDRVHTHTKVLGISRTNTLKGEEIGTGARSEDPFILYVQTDDGERYEETDVIFDTTGVYAEPSKLGPGGLPALGEAQAEDQIARYIPDVLGGERDDYANRRVLVVGGGHSAVTSLKALFDLRKNAPETQVFWALRVDEAPYTRFENDPLPERDQLGAFGNRAASGELEGITPLLSHQVWAMETTADGGLNVTLKGPDEERTIAVDRIVSNVGYRPSLELNRELQVHQCYASEGPMKLAASLLAASGGGGDCLQQESGGVEILKNPEPNYFVLGHKSYGRNSSFLLKIGFDQIQDVLDHLGAP